MNITVHGITYSVNTEVGLRLIVATLAAARPTAPRASHT
jgi:hypothetical protein